MKRRSFIMLFVLAIALMVGSVFAVQEGSIRVQMYNANLAARINTIYPWYRITNAGSTPVNLSDVKIRYFYTIDGEKPQIFKCDWSSAGSANVTGTFVKMEAPFSGADYYFELGFRPGAGYLQPGKSIEVQSRFYKNDWSNYNQTNDYSFNPTSQKYVDWEKIAVQIGEGTVEDFVTSSDFTKDNQWLQEAVTIHLSVTGNGSENATTYYSINDGETMNGKVISINDDGIYKVSFWSKGKTSYTEAPHQIRVKIDRNAPIVMGTIEPAPNANGWLKSDATVSFSATDALSGVASVSPAVSVTTEGAGQIVQGEAKDNLGNTSTTTVTVNIDKTPPVISELYPKSGSVINQTLPVIAANISDNLSGIDASTVKMTVDGREVTASFENGQAIYTPANTLEAGKHTVKLHVSDKAGNPSTEVSSIFTVDSTLPNLPPDPATVAPRLDPTVCTSMLDATKFLYTGENPIQTGVAEETIEARRAAVLRGKVLDKDGQPLPGVKITVLNHPEYGQTYSRADGMFDLAVNGGGYLSVNYERNGYLRSQRQVEVPWNDYAWLPDVVIIKKDTQVSEVTLGADSGIQIARGSVMTDEDGTRQATVIFPDGVQVKGYTGTLHIRATEFTVGASGPKAMPAQLPAASAYTYCVEVGADELPTMEFSKPVYLYVENFLGFKVGGAVPTGFYDPNLGQWLPSEDGRIIQILCINQDGLAEIDLDGSGQPADATALANLGFTDSERRKLTEMYRPGQSLWRSPVSHFSTADCNWPFGFPEGAVAPFCGQLISGLIGNNSCETSQHSTIEMQNQLLKESHPIAGTSFTINYTSERVPGQKSSASVQFPLSGDTLPSVLQNIGVEIYIAGQKHYSVLSPKTNADMTFLWDGKDAYGREVQGKQPLTVRVGYAYQAVYYRGVSQTGMSFARFTDMPRTLELRTAAGDEINGITLWKEYKQSIDIGHFDARGAGLAGWDLNVHHYYDVNTQTIYFGNGSRRKLDNQIVRTVAGNGRMITSNEDGIATSLGVGMVEDIEVGPDGTIYFLSWDQTIRKIDKNGIMSIVAGQPDKLGFNGDGLPAKETIFNDIRGIAIGPDGCLYAVDTRNCRIRKIDRDGIVRTVVGTGRQDYSGDNGPAINASLYSPVAICFDREGNLYITDCCGYGSIRKVSPNGFITTIFRADRTFQYGFSTAYGGNLHAASDGSLYIQAEGHILRLKPDGTREGVVWGSQHEDGISAIDAVANLGLAFGNDGRIYFTDNNKIRMIDNDNTIKTIGGTGNDLYDGDGGSALMTSFATPTFLAASPNGEIYVADASYRLRAISPKLLEPKNNQYIIPAEDGTEIYIFDTNGRHLKTLDALTGTTIYTFIYEDHGYLVAVTDNNGNTTTIERDMQGNPVAIVGPFGQKTFLETNTDGYLSRMTNSAGESYGFSYHEGGLLATQTNPKGFVSRFDYDELGRLTRDEGPDGSNIELSRKDLRNGYEIQSREAVTNNSVKISTYRVEYLPNGDTRWINTGCCGGPTETIFGKDGSERVTKPDGTVISSTKGSDPRFGMLAPYTKTVNVKTPGGLNYTQTLERSISFDPENILSIKTETVKVTVNGKTSTSIYNAENHTVTSTSSMGRKTVTTLDEKGRVIKVEVPGLVPVTFEYDTHGRLYRTTQGSGSEARISAIAYNADGWVENVTDPLLHTTSFEYDAVGRVKKQTLPDNRVIQFSYDSNGNMTTLTPPGKPEHGFSYNSINGIDSYIPPAVTGSGTTSYEYNLAKQPILVTGSDGKTLGYEYDTMGRLITLTLPDGEIAYTYDQNTGRLSNIIAKDGGAISYTYDGSLLTKTTWAGTIKGNVSETYNNDFLLESQSINGSNTIDFTFDNDGLLKTIGDLSYTRKAENGLITGATLGNVNDSVTYNAFGEITDYAATCQNVSTFEEHCTFDKLGRVVTKKEVVNGITVNLSYIYDNGGRLTDVYRDGVLATHYAYDDNGNRIAYSGEKGNLSTTDIVYDEQDRLLKYGQNQYQYAADGELKEKVVGDKKTRYTYDVLGSLTSVILPDGTRLEYLTDGKNRRIGKKINGNLVQGFLYQDSLHPIAELDSTGNVIARFVYGEQVNVPEYMIKSGIKYRIISDRVGSPRVVINEETGEIAQQLNYDEYGNVTLDTNPGFQPFGFAGGIYDKDTGLVHFGAREYDAETGRWTCQDPIGFAGGSSNLYQYVGNDPVNNVDPCGLLFGGLINAGEEYGEQAAQFWADMSIDQSRPGWQRGAACVAGCLAELWTPCTSDTTFTVLTIAWGAGEWAGRPFWRYVGPESRASSPWLTRGLGWEAPYGTDFQAAKDALQIPNMPTGVTKVEVPWWEPVAGPRTVAGHPEWGSGGGLEFFKGWGFPGQ